MHVFRSFSKVQGWHLWARREDYESSRELKLSSKSRQKLYIIICSSSKAIKMQQEYKQSENYEEGVGVLF